MILEQAILKQYKEVRKILYPGLFHGRPVSCGPITNLAYMVTVYIIITDIIAGLIILH